MSPFRIEPLGDHDRAVFSCGVEALDRYFLERARRDVDRNLSAVFVALPKATDGRVAGFYTLAAQEIDAGLLPPEATKRLGKYRRVPATLIGRLAVDRDFQGKKLGEFLLLDALHRSWEMSKQIASFAVVVDAKDSAAASFYAKYEFLPLVGQRYYLPMKTIARLF